MNDSDCFFPDKKFCSTCYWWRLDKGNPEKGCCEYPVVTRDSQYCSLFKLKEGFKPVARRHQSCKKCEWWQQKRRFQDVGFCTPAAARIAYESECCPRWLGNYQEP